METLAASAFVLATLVAILVIMVRGIPGLRARRSEGSGGFDLRRAGVGRSINGYLALSLLAMFGMVQTLIELAPGLGQSATTLVPIAIVIASLGLVIALRATLVVLSLFSVAGVFAAISDAQGAALASAALVLVAMAAWLSGLVRGFTGQGD